MWDEAEINISLRAFLILKCGGKDDIANAIEFEEREALGKLVARDLLPRHNLLNPVLLFATWKGAVEMVADLLGQGANPNAADEVGRTCLHLAAINGKTDVSELLLKKGAGVDVFDKHHLATPLFCAAVSENSQAIKILLDYGANINAGLHEYGVSALHCAVRANSIANVEMLLKLGAIPNNVQLFSETPLHTAASMGFEECVKLLIEHGACLGVLMGSMKMTALHLAAQDGNTESVQYLVTGGANIDSRNARGQSALHLAALAQSPETVEVLLKKGKSYRMCK